MKKLLITTAMTGALMAPAAFAAPTDSTDLEVSATVMEECSIGEPNAVTFSEVEINEGAGADALQLQNGSQADSQNIYVSCNYATSISVSSANDGLLNSAGQSLVDNDPDDFTNLINYRVQMTSTDGSYSNVDFRTRIGGGFVPSATADGAFHDNSQLRVVIDADDTSKRPVAGTYTDTATISLGPI
ncbi:spore coat protein U domain-containing protein [Henriciella sp.]|uniref:spore coat protein U domain-containing protein n=1 Tax=Henriciella sp. TaxID=1968823 RepID=UPI00263A2B23|nr:spore coat protein U domain-containing protein [Henriciella sp.]